MFPPTPPLSGEAAAREAFEGLLQHEAWAVIRRSTRAGDRDTVGLVGGRRERGRVASSTYPSRRACPDGRPHRRPAARDPVPAGARARLRGARRRHAAGRRRHRDRARVLRSPRCSRRIDDTGVEFADRGGFETADDEYAERRRGDHPRRDRPGRGRQPGHRPALPRGGRRLGRRQGADRLPPAARARARRVLDLLLLHRRPLPDRRQPRAARQRPRRRRPDEPDQRHLPDRAQSGPAG